tara:strand:+ start:456 stop:758 length:303 start_codon:yes stop_codon:yes gene_type:complete
MKKFFFLKIFLILFLVSSCQTINEKSESISKKENEKLSKFIGQPISELKVVMGAPDQESKDEKGSKILIYKNKKYGISCERKFEINEVDMVVGFSSKGCF